MMNTCCKSGSESSKVSGNSRRNVNTSSRMNKLKEKLKSYNLCHMRKEVKRLRKNVQTSTLSYQQLEEYLDLERNQNMMLLREFANYKQQQDEIIHKKQQEYNHLLNHHEKTKARNEDIIFKLTEQIKNMGLEMQEKQEQEENVNKSFLNESMLEVTSLQSVLEMKQEEIRHIRVKLMTLQSKVDKIPQLEKLLEQQKSRCEDLECQITIYRNAKINLEVDNNKLRQLLKLESKERETLTMMNEMLKWNMQVKFDLSQE